MFSKAVLGVTNNWCYTNFDKLIEGVDAVIVKGSGKDFKILTITRTRYPNIQLPAFPGGLVDAGETPEETIYREAYEEVGLTKHDILSDSMILDMDESLKHLWDPRGSKGVKTYAKVFYVREEWEPVAGDDAAAYEWKSLKEILQSGMAFLHTYWLVKGQLELLLNESELGALEMRLKMDIRRQIEFIRDVNVKRLMDGMELIPLKKEE